MADRRDVNSGDGQSGGYTLAGAIRFAYEERRWLVAGEREDDAAVTLQVIVQAPGDAEMVKRYEVRIPLRVDGDDLVAGEPEVAQI